jgi:hypothetical protein
VAQRLQQFGTLDGDLHREIRSRANSFTSQFVHEPSDGWMTKVARRTALRKAGPPPARPFPSLSPVS